MENDYHFYTFYCVNKTNIFVVNETIDFIVIWYFVSYRCNFYVIRITGLFFHL